MQLKHLPDREFRTLLQGLIVKLGTSPDLLFMTAIVKEAARRLDATNQPEVATLLTPTDTTRTQAAKSLKEVASLLEGHAVIQSGGLLVYRDGDSIKIDSDLQVGLPTCH